MSSSRAVLVALIILFSTHSVGHAMWAKMPDAQLVERSTMIVSAQLLGVTEFSFESASIAQQRVGILEVEKVFKGNGSARYILLVLPAATGLRVSSSIDYPIGSNGLWFLREAAGDEGLFYADNPQRFWSIDKLPVLEQLLRQ